TTIRRIDDEGALARPQRIAAVVPPLVVSGVQVGLRIRRPPVIARRSFGIERLGFFLGDERLLLTGGPLERRDGGVRPHALKVGRTPLRAGHLPPRWSLRRLGRGRGRRLAIHGCRPDGQRDGDNARQQLVI